jgi:cytochrome c2
MMQKQAKGRSQAVNSWTCGPNYWMLLFNQGGGFMQSRIFIWVLMLVIVASFWIYAAEKGNAVKGKEVFSRCAVCHGESGQGKEAIAKAYGVTMPQLGSKEVQSLNDAALKKSIIEGKGKMKPVNLTDQEAADVIAFLRTLKK